MGASLPADRGWVTYIGVWRLSKGGIRYPVFTAWTYRHGGRGVRVDGYHSLIEQFARYRTGLLPTPESSTYRPVPPRKVQPQASACPPASSARWPRALHAVPPCGSIQRVPGWPWPKASKRRWRSAWPTLSAGGLARLELPDTVRELIILADHDASGTGIRAAQTLATRLHRAGLTVHLALPPTVGCDWNDMLRAGDGI